MALTRRQDPERTALAPFDWVLPDWWYRFDELLRDGEGHQLIRVEEFDEDGTRVIRAEMPGIDPEKDVEVSVAGGALTIRAERSQTEESTKRRFRRHEIRYGAFSRSLPLPEGVQEGDVTASYRDGILEVRVPMPKAQRAEATRIPVAHS